jgi:hypothetical protein
LEEVVLALSNDGERIETRRRDFGEGVVSRDLDIKGCVCECEGGMYLCIGRVRELLEDYVLVLRI